MNKLIIRLIFVSFVINACHDRGKIYENNPGGIARTDTTNYTTIEWQDSLRNFGIVKEGDSVLMKFRFKNTGDKPLFLIKVQPSCGCTVVDYPRAAIPPGKGGEVTAAFNTRYHPGNVYKTIVVTTNTLNGIYHLLTFTGQVKYTPRLNH